MASLAANIVVDRYRVLSRLGQGAMGEVWLAEDIGLGRKVALKMLSEGHRDNAEVRARFIREARAVAAVSHPNVVQVFTTGEWDGRPYLAMEFLDGQDLQTLVRQEGPIPSARAAVIIADAARGLAAAARAGLIHRDVKPSNIMNLPDGTIKVTDFGLAKPVEPGTDPALTALGVVVGTPDYIAPEQARGDDIDHRVDIYALGSTLFFLLTGRPPYRASLDDDEKYMRVVARHLRDPVPDPRKDRKEVDDELAEITKVMMAKEADRRYAYDFLIARLERVAARLSGVLPEAEMSRQVRASTAGGSRLTAGPSAVTHPSLIAGPREDEEPVESLGSLDTSYPGRRGGLSRGLVAVTVLAFLIFLTGLGLFLFGPLPERPKEVTVYPPDAAPLVAPPPDAAAVLVETTKPPPPDMLLVEGAKPFYVDRAVVTHKRWAEFQVKHRYAKKDADKPVTGVSFDYARQYAAFRGKRLVRVDEWEAASRTPAFVPAGMKLVEWVDDGKATGTAERPVRGVNGASGMKKAAGAADTTFRLALDP